MDNAYLSSDWFHPQFNRFMCFCIFKKLSHLRFFKLLQIYTFNCTLVNLNDTVICILNLTLTEIFYYYGSSLFVLNQTYVIYYTYIFKTIWSLTFTVSSLLDLLIVYERILIYLPHMTFLRHTSPSCILFGVLTYTIVINVPIFLSRDHIQYTLVFNGNMTFVYFDKFKQYHYQKVF